MERTKAMSSTQVARCGNKLETSIPHSPYFLNGNELLRNSLGLANRFAWSVFFSLLQSITVLSNFSRLGFGSKVSIWLTPPSMVRNIQDLAFGVWSGFLGASGLSAARRLPFNRLISAMPPTPVRL